MGLFFATKTKQEIYIFNFIIHMSNQKQNICKVDKIIDKILWNIISKIILNSC